MQLPEGVRLSSCAGLRVLNARWALPLLSYEVASCLKRLPEDNILAQRGDLQANMVVRCGALNA